MPHQVPEWDGEEADVSSSGGDTADVTVLDGGRVSQSSPKAGLGDGEPWAHTECSQASVPPMSSLSLSACNNKAWASGSGSACAL